jgi:hypothetical protein
VHSVHTYIKPMLFFCNFVIKWPSIRIFLCLFRNYCLFRYYSGYWAGIRNRHQTPLWLSSILKVHNHVLQKIKLRVVTYNHGSFSDLKKKNSLGTKPGTGAWLILKILIVRTCGYLQNQIPVQYWLIFPRVFSMALFSLQHNTRIFGLLIKGF